MAQAAELPGTVARRHRTPVWVGAGLLLVAASMRLPIGSVGPVLEELRDGVGLSSGGAGILTTLPVLCFGLAASVGPPLARRWGDEQVVLACVAIVALGTLVRAVPEVGPLFAGTLLLGIGIAVANVLLPSVIKRDYDQPGTMMGLYTMVLTASAAVAAGLTVPLEHALGSWQWALAAWAAPVALAVAWWVPVVARARSATHAEPAGPPVRLWRDRTAWLVTGFMGLQSLLFYVLLAWLPDILRDSGLTAGEAGLMLSVCMVFALPGSLLAPIAAARIADQGRIVLAAAVLWAVGLVGLLVAPAGGTLAWMVALGLAQGAAFGLSMALIVLRAPDGAHAAALSGMVQTFGYALAAVGPLAVGLLHELTGAWTAAILLLLAVAVGELVTGLAASRSPMVAGVRAVR